MRIPAPDRHRRVILAGREIAQHETSTDIHALDFHLRGAGVGPDAIGRRQESPRQPSGQTSGTVTGKTITIKYWAPSMRGREHFRQGRRGHKDPTYPVWRAGANGATALHTDADLISAAWPCPKAITRCMSPRMPDNWQLIVNKQTGQWGLSYDQSQDLGRVPRTMSKPPAPVETYKMTLSARRKLRQTPA